MPRVSILQAKMRIIIFFLTAAIIVAADQLSKIWIRTNLAIGESFFELGFFQIIRITPNTGAAFGLFRGQTFILIIVSLIVVALLLTYALYLYRYFPFLNNSRGWVALGLIFGGTTGNLIDRLNPALSGVTDFINIGFWPTFNIADSATTIGTIIFAYSLLRLALAERQ